MAIKYIKLLLFLKFSDSMHGMFVNIRSWSERVGENNSIRFDEELYTYIFTWESMDSQITVSSALLHLQ